MRGLSKDKFFCDKTQTKSIFKWRLAFGNNFEKDMVPFILYMAIEAGNASKTVMIRPI